MVQELQCSGHTVGDDVTADKIEETLGLKQNAALSSEGKRDSDILYALSARSERSNRSDNCLLLPLEPLVDLESSKGFKVMCRDQSLTRDHANNKRNHNLSIV